MKLLTLILSLMAVPALQAAAAQAELKDLSINGGVQDGKARLVIEGQFKGGTDERDKLIFATALQQSIAVSREKIVHSITASIDVLQGDPKELPFTLQGDAQIQKVTGDQLQDWSVRQESNGVRVLVIRPRKGDKPLTQMVVNITADRELKTWSNPVAMLTLAPAQPALFNGFVKVEFAEELDVRATNSTGLFPIDPRFLPEKLHSAAKSGEPEALAFRFHGSGYTLPLYILSADPEARRVVFRDFKLSGRLGDTTAAFSLTALARVKNPNGASISLMSGGVALTELEAHPDWRLKFENGQFVLRFDRAGEFPVHIKFNAAVRQANGWSSVDFRVAPSALQPVSFEGLAADTQFQFAGAARPERVGADFVSYLPPDGAVKLSWKQTRPEAEGKLFYSAEMLSQISISPGLMRQIALVEFRVMQGELSSVVLLLRGAGSVTRVQGIDVLEWKVEPGATAEERRLLVVFNQPQKDVFGLQIQMQTELGVFPQAADAMQLRPEAATRFAGHFRVVNEGAVRLEVVQSTGLSQISPEQFPESDATKALFGGRPTQRFAFRFSSVDFALRVQADNVLPELSVSQLLAYHLGETELAIEVELELDIREAPVRELALRIPKNYAIAKLTASGLSDYFSTDTATEPDAQLRLVYGQPLFGRQVVQLRLERNAALGDTNWVLPRIEVVKAKSTRGHVGVAADAGFRLTAERTQALTEIATAFFPKKLAGIQAAFRLSDPAWQATMRVERLPQTIHADVFHLFSIGEGVGYGSSTINYLISGAPISTFQVDLSAEYFNVEFTGKDIRNWQKTTNGYVVQLHTPAAGPYTLLATYERPFKAQGDTLTFTGARPLNAQSEQGHTIVISAYQFEVKPVSVSAGLMELETAEVPAEYRLFFDAPILKAYRYTSRPFNLQLALSPLQPSATLNMVVDRAAITNHISKDGEVLTDARYFLKSQGNPAFPLTLPGNTELWSATVNGTAVVPVKDGSTNLIPLAQTSDPNRVEIVDFETGLNDQTTGASAGRRADCERAGVARGMADRAGHGKAVDLSRGQPGSGRWLARCLGVCRIGAIVRGTPIVAGIHKADCCTGPAGAVNCRMALGDRPRGLSIQFPACRGRACRIGGLRPGGVHPGDACRSGPLRKPRGARQPFLPGPGAAARQRIERGGVEHPGGDLVPRVGPAIMAGAHRLDRLGLFDGHDPHLAAADRSGGCLDDADVGDARLAQWRACVVFRVPRIFGAPPVDPRVETMDVAAPQTNQPAAPDPAPAAAILLLLGGLLLLGTGMATAQTQTTPSTSALSRIKDVPLAESISQKIQVEEKYALATAKIRWLATRDQLLPLLYEPAVLTRIQYPTNALKLVQSIVGSKRAYQLLAQKDGAFDIEVQYQLQVARRDTESGFILPTQHGLVNQLTLTLADIDVDVAASQAVSVDRESVGSNTVARLILSPANDTWIGWKPRSRDVKREKTVFFAELVQLYAPSAGVIEGAHQVQVRPAQGELSELILDVQGAATITDVSDNATFNPQAEGTKPADARAPKTSIVSLWRFAPDTHKLRISLNPPQSRPFTIWIRSQVATGPLPFEQTVGLLSVTNAARQLGLLGVATGNEVQLDSVTADAFSAINIEDFPPSMLQTLSGQIAGLTLRRAFRYADPNGVAVLKASAVEPDVRIEAQQTLSLGEDRTVLAANLTVNISRAGIFRMSFLLPPGLDVEAVSGAALSHWTELPGQGGRIVTLHLKGKTEGQQQFSINLAGPGTKATNGWTVPRLVIREAGKQRGQLVIVPEQGMRLQIVTREGLTQLDPQKVGIRQKGVLAFRLLQEPWNLALDVEQVDSWIQVLSLQHVTVNEAQVKVAANLQYQIDNTGLKALRVLIPTNAESVRFRGEQVADFLPVAGAVTNEMQLWEVKLHRRVLGKFLLQATYQTPVGDQVTRHVVRGVQALDVNLQRGFLTVESGGRLQVRVATMPDALQRTEWQSIPRSLRQDIEAASANHTFRLIEPAYQLPLQFERHEATKLLAAHINAITLTSVISDEGVMLTEVRLEMIPGDTRLLKFTLPSNGQFWFAFVNQNGVSPWREQDRILVPLEQSSLGKPVTIELFYSSRIGSPGGRHLDLALLGPKFDLPLENITWRVFLNEKWRLNDWAGSLQLQENRAATQTGSVDVQAYLQNEASLKLEKTREAEQMLSMGNSLLERGDPQQARRAFRSAYGLSTHDDAFNEDARVQLHNLKLQQALVGLNVRQASVAGDNENAPGNKLNDLRNRKEVTYTQQEAKQMIDANTADDNAAFMRLAERLIQQQDAAVASPAAIRASVPQQGRVLTFRRAVQVDTDLRLELRATVARAASTGVTVLILGGIFVVLAVLAAAGRSLTRREGE